MGVVSSIVDSPTISQCANAAIAVRARARYPWRSPMFEPSAMYATSRIRVIGAALDDHLGVRQRAAECNVRLADRHARPADARAARERAGRDAFANLLEIVDMPG